MKKFYKILSILLALIIVVTCFAGCNNNPDNPSTPDNPGNEEFVDYASQVKFDPNSGRAHVETTVHRFVDGDTTHFKVPSSIAPNGILKARYLGINTPESTGQIEPWGEKASNYTRSKLESATSIIIESDTASWNPDSTGERFLVWIWYKTADMADYRCLNLEILQEGLALASKSSDTVYADVCVKILAQATAHKLYVFSKEKDPDFYYGAAKPITLRELKTNIEDYLGTSVSFEGTVVRRNNNTAYVEEYDEETGLYFGMQVYYGYNLGFHGEEILSVGNRVLVVGSVQYYEAGGTYQISDIKYHAMRPNDEENIQKISEGHEAAYQEISPKKLLTEKITAEITKVDEDGNEVVETKSFDVGFLTMHGTASMKGLKIKSIYTTKNEDSANYGALSITCTSDDGTEIILRTVPFTKADGTMVTAADFPIGSIVDAKGIVDVYDGVYQLKVLLSSDITIVQ